MENQPTKLDKTLRILIFFIVIQMVIILWGIYYITTNSNKKIENDCADFSFNMFSYKINENENTKSMRNNLYNECVSAGGSKKWEYFEKDTSDIKDQLESIQEEIGDIKLKFNIF